MRIITIVFLGLVLLSGAGCSDFCRASAYSGFAIGDLVCIPHNAVGAVHLVKDVYNDTKPGGMLSKKSSPVSQPATPISNSLSYGAGSTSLHLTTPVVNSPSL